MICSKLFIFDSYKYKNPKTICLVNRSLAGNLRNVTAHLAIVRVHFTGLTNGRNYTLIEQPMKRQYALGPKQRYTRK